MHITNYQVHNVLRTYSKQLSLSKRAVHKRLTSVNQPDNITISGEAKRKAVIEKVTKDIVDRIVHSGPRNNVEQEAFAELENEYGKNLATEEDVNTEFIFKVIDKDKSEEIKTLSIEDSKVLRTRLEEITKNKIDANMFR
ncbi:MAG: hypothetical protein JRD47_03005 [Deltaproteobacteria bacterium]|nr:hypothetical protein [Deltaproteobacteria bacterium]MBW2600890.1 hypothetical protein [Deltaproteobacteria bacterium]